MVTDAALWLILVVMVGWVVCGCYATQSRPVQQDYEARSREQLKPGRLNARHCPAEP